MAAADAFSKAILPLVNQKSIDDAQSLDQKMAFSLTRKPLRDCALSIAKAIDNAISRGLEMECAFFGSQGGITLACFEEGNGRQYPISVYVVSLITTVAAIFVMYTKIICSRLSEQLKHHIN